MNHWLLLGFGITNIGSLLIYTRLRNGNLRLEDKVAKNEAAIKTLKRNFTDKIVENELIMMDLKRNYNAIKHCSNL